ncbi:MAG: DUF4375 domain-containing protein [Nibricoccus sp.]
MSTLRDQIQGKSPFEIVRLVQNSIFETKCQPLEEYESYSKRLTRGEQYAILCYVFVVEVANGGLNQYLCNSSGDYANPTSRIFEEIGAHVSAAALADVQRMIYGNKPIPTSRPERCDTLFAWEEKNEEYARDFFHRIDRKLGWCEEVDKAMGRYILSHLDEF